MKKQVASYGIGSSKGMVRKDEIVQLALEWLDLAVQAELPTEEEIQKHPVPDSLNDWFEEWIAQCKVAEEE